MAFNSEVHYEYDPTKVNEIMAGDEESGNYVALREVRWKPDGTFGLDLRRYFVKNDTEVPGKGITINDPTKLVSTLVEYSYVDPSSVFAAMKRADMLELGLGEYTAYMSDDEYEEFKKQVDWNRTAVIADRGLSPEQFMEELK